MCLVIYGARKGDCLLFVTQKICNARGRFIEAAGFAAGIGVCEYPEQTTLMVDACGLRKRTGRAMS